MSNDNLGLIISVNFACLMLVLIFLFGDFQITIRENNPISRGFDAFNYYLMNPQLYITNFWFWFVMFALSLPFTFRFVLYPVAVIAEYIESRQNKSGSTNG